MVASLSPNGVFAALKVSPGRHWDQLTFINNLASINPSLNSFVVRANLLQLGRDSLLVRVDLGADHHEVVWHFGFLVDNHLLWSHGKADREQWATDSLQVPRLHVSAQVVADLVDAVLLDTLQLVETLDLCLDLVDVAGDIPTQH